MRSCMWQAVSVWPRLHVSGRIYVATRMLVAEVELLPTGPLQAHSSRRSFVRGLWTLVVRCTHGVISLGAYQRLFRIASKPALTFGR